MQDFGTRAVHVGYDPSTVAYRPLVPPIFYNGSEKALYDNTSLISLEKCLASLEHAKYALCYPCGVSTAISVTLILDKGDHAVVFDSVYHGTRNSFSMCENASKIQVTFIDLRDANNLEKHLKENTKVVWIETPCNPTMKLVDIAAIAEILKKQRRKIFLVVDNTFMSPYFQNPLVFGADISIQSLTKYANGHADCLMGVMATNCDELYSKLKETRDATGMVPSPMECFLVHRGLKTLHIRMERHMQNAFEIAKYLEQHPKVEKVYYPGLPSHPQYDLAKRQCKGFSGMVSFCIKGSSAEATKFVENLKIFTLAVSLGGLESLIEIPFIMTASALTEERRLELEITENLIRMSVGTESSKDLIDDLNQAFEKI